MEEVGLTPFQGDSLRSEGAARGLIVAIRHRPRPRVRSCAPTIIREGFEKHLRSCPWNGPVALEQVPF
ncbi:MAG TPA: hypothetical protein PLQ49_01780 [Methanothrix sp.]|nr:hypothetical protein [Methanothrix sp.]HRW82777.1 hypothetical protein [Methanothrix sp.]